MDLEHKLTGNLTFTNLARKVRNGLAGVYMLATASGFGLGFGGATKANAEVVDPQIYSTPTAELVTLTAPVNSSQQTLNLTLDTTLPVPYEGETDLTNGWILEVAPIHPDGTYMTQEELAANDNRLDDMLIRIIDTNSSYEEIRKIKNNTGDETNVNAFTIPYLLISGPDFSNVAIKYGAMGTAFNGGDGSNMIMFKPQFPRRLIFPTSNETTYNETEATQNIVDEANRIPAGYENAPRVTDVSTVNLEFITGAYDWDDYGNDFNVSGCLWKNSDEMNSSGFWEYGLMLLRRSTATPDAIRNEVEAFRGLIENIRESGEISDGENLGRRLGDSITRDTQAEPGTPFMNDFYAPNSSDGSGQAPGDLPDYVVLSIPLTGTMTEGQLQMYGVVATEQMPMGSVKAMFR